MEKISKEEFRKKIKDPEWVKNHSDILLKDILSDYDEKPKVLRVKNINNISNYKDIEHLYYGNLENVDRQLIEDLYYSKEIADIFGYEPGTIKFDGIKYFGASLNSDNTVFDIYLESISEHSHMVRDMFTINISKDFISVDCTDDNLLGQWNYLEEHRQRIKEGFLSIINFLIYKKVLCKK